MVIVVDSTKVKPGYKQTEVGVIPEDWKLKPIGDSFDICNHLRYPISQDVRKKMVGVYPYYGPTKAQDYINEYRVEGGYALIGEDGDHFLKWRESPMTLLVNGKFNVNNHAHLVKGTKNLTSWFYYYFQNKDLTPYLTRQGAGRYKLTKNTLVTIPCPLPSPKEQAAIVAALSDIDALITSLDKLIAKKRDIKQATMQQLLTGKMRLPGFGGEWEVKKLGEICEFYSGGTPSTSNSLFYGGNISWITSSDLNKGRIKEVEGRITKLGFEKSSAKMVKKGTLLLALYGATAGVSAITEFNAAINQAVLAIIPQKDNSEFIFQKLTLLKDWLIKTYTQGGQPNLSGQIVKQVEFSFPPKAEQQAIATVLSDMDAEIGALEQKREKTRALKQGMMQELLTGKTRLI